MKLKSIAGVIFLVTDLDQTIKFYKALGFEFRKQNPGISAHAYLNWFWIEFLMKDRVVTEALKEDVDKKAAGQYMHVNVEDVDDYYQDLLAQGLNPVSKPEDFPWGHREFVLQDPDGHKLVFFTKK